MHMSSNSDELILCNILTFGTGKDCLCSRQHLQLNSIDLTGGLELLGMSWSHHRHKDQPLTSLTLTMTSSNIFADWH